MSFGIYVREFNENKYYQSNTNVFSPSKYFPFPMKEILCKSKNIKDTDYILCPLYSKKDNFLKSDFQLGVTGTVEEKEDFKDTLFRELGEELGLIPKTINELKRFKWRRSHKDTIEFVVYEANIKNCTLILDSDEKIFTVREENHIDKKVGCYIYGELKDILQFLDSPKINRYKNEDEICGIVAIQKRIAKEIYLK